MFTEPEEETCLYEPEWRFPGPATTSDDTDELGDPDAAYDRWVESRWA
jgi:hypothetical protein